MRVMSRYLAATPLCLALLASTAQPLPHAPANDPTSPSTSLRAGPSLSPTASIAPEVRLRKLHLVRPDLIPYPLAYEVYC
jgi:hypothetical protein